MPLDDMTYFVGNNGNKLVLAIDFFNKSAVKENQTGWSSKRVEILTF